VVLDCPVPDCADNLCAHLAGNRPCFGTNWRNMAGRGPRPLHHTVAYFVAAVASLAEPCHSRACDHTVAPALESAHQHVVADTCRPSAVPVAFHTSLSVFVRRASADSDMAPSFVTDIRWPSLAFWPSVLFDCASYRSWHPLAACRSSDDHPYSFPYWPFVAWDSSVRN